MGLADLKRVTDLFVEGEEVVLRDGEDPVLLWVNKLNSFEMEEARRDGAAARSRLVLALKEIGSPDYEQFEASLVELTNERIVDELVATKTNEFFVDVVGAIQRDPEWTERLEATTRRTPEMSPEEHEMLARIDQDYSVEVQDRLALMREQAKRDFERNSLDELKELYRESWLESRGMAAFSREFQKTQLYFALRTCRARAKLSGTSAWDHAACEGHRQRALDNREEVTQLPPTLLERLLTAVRSVTVDRRDARFSGALASSSGSSAQPSGEAASTPSTQEAKPDELATTSS